MKELQIDDQTLLELIALQEQQTILDRNIKRRIAAFAKRNAIDPDTHTLQYDIFKGKILYEKTQKDPTKD